ncbi:MAG: hypothetical protein IJ355_06250, partial [Prevotella sp.]|nr:hypothetical protein [Prevotella sp.]
MNSQQFDFANIQKSIITDTPISVNSPIFKYFYIFLQIEERQDESASMVATRRDHTIINTTGKTNRKWQQNPLSRQRGGRDRSRPYNYQHQRKKQRQMTTEPNDPQVGSRP